MVGGRSTNRVPQFLHYAPLHSRPFVANHSSTKIKTNKKHVLGKSSSHSRYHIVITVVYFVPIAHLAAVTVDILYLFPP